MDRQEFLKDLFAFLGIDANFDIADITYEAALDLITEKLSPLKERLAAEAVQQAIAGGKLYSSEHDWALDQAKRNLGVFKAFVKLRAKVPAIAARLSAQTPGALKIDDLQKTINQQVGVSEALFARYNTRP